MVVRWVKPDDFETIRILQKKFILHGGVIDDLCEIYEKQGKAISAQYHPFEFVLNPQIVKTHFIIKNKIETERELYSKLKKEFSVFFSK